MKIAIKANPSRGKEIISLLKSLGGINDRDWNGDGELDIYYIDKDNKIQYDFPPKDYKVYTLEEFEKEFPFKIGDIILLKGVNKPYEIIALEWYMNKLCYKLDSGLHYAPETLTTCGKMKEERNIKLTLEKAKEWYKKGGELKEIALQAFTERELTKVDLPKSWEEFCTDYPIQTGEAIIDEQTSQIRIYKGIVARGLTHDKNIYPSEKSAEAHLAMIQLEQLRDCWRQGWEPDWLNVNTTKYAIKAWRDKSSIETTYVTHAFLSFPTYELAFEFQECFRDLIKKAGDLI